MRKILCVILTHHLADGRSLLAPAWCLVLPSTGAVYTEPSVYIQNRVVRIWPAASVPSMMFPAAQFTSWHHSGLSELVAFVLFLPVQHLI